MKFLTKKETTFNKVKSSQSVTLTKVVKALSLFTILFACFHLGRAEFSNSKQNGFEIKPGQVIGKMDRNGALIMTAPEHLVTEKMKTAILKIEEYGGIKKSENITVTSVYLNRDEDGVYLVGIGHNEKNETRSVRIHLSVNNVSLIITVKAVGDSGGAERAIKFEACMGAPCNKCPEPSKAGCGDCKDCDSGKKCDCNHIVGNTSIF